MKSKLLFLSFLVTSLFFSNAKAQVDVTNQYIKNPKVKAVSDYGWTIQYNAAGGGVATQNDSVYDIFTSKVSTAVCFVACQPLTGLEEGVYRATVNAFNRSSQAYTNVIFYGETTEKQYQVNIKNQKADSLSYSSNDGKTIPYGGTTEATEVSKAFYSETQSGGYWLNVLDNVIVKDGKLTIGITNIGQFQVINTTVGSRTVFGNFKLYKLVGSALKPLLTNKITEANTLASKNYSNVAALNNAISTAQAIDDKSIAYNDIKVLQQAIDTYKTGSLADATTSNPVDATAYVKNASFEDGAILMKVNQITDSIADTSGHYAISGAGGYFNPVNWKTTIKSARTLMASNNWDAIVVCDAVVFPIAKGTYTGNASDGTYYYAARKRWDSGAISTEQTITDLPAGNYKISVDLSTGKTSNTTTGTFTASVGETAVLTAKPTSVDFTTFTSNQFTVNAGDQLLLKMAMNGGSDYRILMDNIKLTYLGNGSMTGTKNNISEKDIKIINTTNGVLIRSQINKNIKVYSFSGQLIKSLNIAAGDNFVELKQGLYLIDGVKTSVK
ncbi:MAG: hypothetical protein QM751_11275 [Paludibacteraceae bacterium]